MDLRALKLASLGFDKARFGRVVAFVDFGNVNYWYHKDRRDWDDKLLSTNQRLIVDISKLATFLNALVVQKRFYYGFHQRLKRSWHIVAKAESNGFVRVTKPIQFVRHYLDSEETLGDNTGVIKEDGGGRYIEIPKSNFDVEISVDAMRLLDRYDTMCLLSGDSDFARLSQFIKRMGKQVIVIASGQVFHTLKDTADLYINAQKIKHDIAAIKETSLH